MNPPKYAWNNEFKYTEKELELIAKINKFLDSPLSPRWIYYGLYDDPDAKKQAELTKILNKSTKDKRQLIKRDMVCDDTRSPTIWNSSKDLKTFLEELNYSRNVWENQPIYYEVWIEDQASLEAIKKSKKKILQKYRINARYCKGFNSNGAMWESYKFFKDFQKPIKILYFGDLNPSGWAIPLVIVRQFQELGLDIELKRCGLNVDQLERYNIKTLTKITGDPRRKEFNNIFGYQEWENQELQQYYDEKTKKWKKGKKHLNIDLEKIPKTLFEDLMEEAIVSHIDIDKFKESISKEDIEVTKLENFKATYEGDF